MNTLQFSDRLLPNQEVLCSDYTGMQNSYHSALFEYICHASNLKIPETDFKLHTSNKFTIEEMGSDPINLRLFEMLIRLSNARRVLEIGTFIGVSTMCFARALPDDGEVVTIEKYDHFAEIARDNFKQNGFNDRISLIEGDAMAIIDGFADSESFDFIFLDGDKENYPAYFSKLEPLLSEKGIMVIDDVFFHGDAVNDQPNSKKGLGVKQTLEMINKRDDFSKVVLPLCNGVMILMRQ